MASVAILLTICGLAFLGPLARPSQAQSSSPSLFATSEEAATPTTWAAQLESLQDASILLPLAAILSTILAYRPRRRGTPTRKLAVVQTQIILAIVGAIVMLVVGTSLARAFGIVGAAGLVRYRAKVDDPKDAGVMLSTLAIGLASGVGVYALAIFATIFVLITLWILESLEPEPHSVFELTIRAKDSAAIKNRIEQTLRRHRVSFELRSTSPEDISYEVRVPLSRDTEASRGLRRHRSEANHRSEVGQKKDK